MIQSNQTSHPSDSERQQRAASVAISSGLRVAVGSFETAYREIGAHGPLLTFEVRSNTSFCFAKAVIQFRVEFARKNIGMAELVNAQLMKSPPSTDG